MRWLIPLICVACTAPSPLPQRQAEPARSPATEPAPSPPPEAPRAPARRPIVLMDDPEALDVVEQGPGAFASLVDGAALQVITRTLAADLDRVQRSDKRAGTSIARHAHRLLDRRWLDADSARFELVAVSNRFDRRPFTDSACGELRLVYRLSYEREVQGQALSSRLPVALSVELFGEPPEQGSCQAAAARWLAPPDLAGRALGAWLTSSEGPLGSGRVAPGRLARINTNVQSVRWPSTVRPDLGGHAEYVLRSFVPSETGLKAGPLENTPDVARLERLPAERRALLDWLRQPDTLAALDRGVAIVPQRFLATQAISVTPHGLARRSNRPFRQLFAARDLAELELEGYASIGSPEALIRRLDALSCPGCHQSRSLAGFHVLGRDEAGTALGNELFTSVSPHLHGDLERRRALVEAAAAGEELDFGAPFAERPATSQGGYGEHCGLGDPGFGSWTCQPGLACQPYGVERGEPRTVGVCLPPQATAGDPCEKTELTQNDDPHRDRIAQQGTLPCAPSAATCNRSAVGFPGGMCTASCNALPPEAACGAIAVLTSFNDCLARNQPFSSCIAQNSSPAGLRRCDLDHPCRDDYLCARTPQGDGVCIPPYFLFQLRVDGHPSPVR